ncbi:MAG: hypothetical protein Q4D02_03795 [Clostridia bacterium]|nr:hypothetical protein [Clostridia bacterium]
MQKVNLKEIVFPNNGISTVSYFKAGVLWILAGEHKPIIRKAEKGEKSTLNDPEVIKVISEAVPGQNSYLMDLTIRSNINECVISDPNYTLEEKVSKIADSISKFVIC